jgi:hypothetical protein
MRMTLLALLFTAGCLANGPGGGGEGVDDGEPPAETESCGVANGVLEGGVYYWGLPGEPDSVAADSVDVFLTNGGPTFRTPTDVNGRFAVELPEGEWLVAADAQTTGCADENTETVTVTPCEATQVELLIDLCEP